MNNLQKITIQHSYAPCGEVAIFNSYFYSYLIESLLKLNFNTHNILKKLKQVFLLHSFTCFNAKNNIKLWKLLKTVGKGYEARFCVLYVYNFFKGEYNEQSKMFQQLYFRIIIQ